MPHISVGNFFRKLASFQEKQSIQSDNIGGQKSEQGVGVGKSIPLMARVVQIKWHQTSKLLTLQEKMGKAGDKTPPPLWRLSGIFYNIPPPLRHFLWYFAAVTAFTM